MPLVAHNALPTFSRLADSGHTVLPPDRARDQDIRELHIGLLNMMPDAALEATERQFMTLVGESNPIAQFYIHPFSIDALPRGAQAQQHVDKYYESFDRIRDQGLDALIISGANVTRPNLAEEIFWQPLIEVIDWGFANVTSTLCSCLTTHAVLQFRYNQRRTRLDAKRWGVYSHRVLDKSHPLVKDVNTRFDVPHSRFNDVSREQFTAAGLRILAESEAAGVHLAVSSDGFRFVFFQAHPEYDAISLLKEYKREVYRYIDGEVEEYPPFPDNYFSAQTRAVFDEFRLRLGTARSGGHPPPDFPEHLANPDNTWHDTGRAVISNWLGSVYQITHRDRKIPFMQGVDKDNPLGLPGV